MKEIRTAFHDVLNQLNKISVKAGAVIDQSKMEDSLYKKDEKEIHKKALETLSFVEQTALEAGEAMKDLKKKVYDLLKIDTSKPLD